MATHSSILAWRIPWTEEPGRLHTVHGVAKSQTWLSESESRSVVSNSLQPLGILQARILEWVAFSFSRGSYQPREDMTEHTPKEETGREASVLWEHQVVIQVPGKGRGDKRKTRKEGTQTNTVWFYLYDVLRIVKLIGSESTLGDARGRGLWSNENEPKAEKEGWMRGLSQNVHRTLSSDLCLEHNMQGRDYWARMAEPFELEATGKQGSGHLQTQTMGFPGGSVVRSPLTNAEDMVWSLVREDPTCREATKPVCHNYWACPKPQILTLHAATTEAMGPRVCAPQEKPP